VWSDSSVLGDEPLLWFELFLKQYIIVSNYISPASSPLRLRETLEIPVDLIIRVRGEWLSHLSIISHSPHPKKFFARHALPGCERASPEVPEVSQPVNPSLARGGLGGWQFPVALTACDASAREAFEAACSAEPHGA